MTWQPDALLLELLGAMEKELARALELRQRQLDARMNVGAEESSALFEQHARRILSLRGAMSALEGALERGASRITH